MDERTKLDELFMSQALGRGVLSSVQIHRLMEEVKRRRMTRPSLFAHDVAVELKLITQDTAVSLLRSESVQQTLVSAGPALEPVRTMISAPAKQAPPAPLPLPPRPPTSAERPPSLVAPAVRRSDHGQREVSRPSIPPLSPERAAQTVPLSWQPAPPLPPPLPPAPQRMPSLLEPARPLPSVEPEPDAMLEPSEDTDAAFAKPAALRPDNHESAPPLLPTLVESPGPMLEPTLIESPEITDSSQTATEGLLPTIQEAPKSKSSITSRETPIPPSRALRPPPRQEEPVPQTMLEPARLVARKVTPTSTEKIDKLEPTLVEPPKLAPIAEKPAQPPAPQGNRPPSMLEPIVKTEPPKILPIDTSGPLAIATPNPSTGGASGTSPVTGAAVRAGLGAGSKLGIETDITDAEHIDVGGDERPDDNTDIFGAEMTIAQLREKKGLGQGVALDDRGERLKAATRMRFGDVAHRRYKVLREIARGGMGKVLEVIDTDLRRPVALKVLRSEMLENKDIVERFLEEAQITGQLEHPNIVPVHEIGVDARKNLYFTMKLVEGMDLATIFQKLNEKDPETVKTYTLSKLLDILIKVCEGISFAHSKGVIHRDLKPPNIMVGRFGEVQIMDWGIARIVGARGGVESKRMVMTDRREDEEGGQTMVGTLVGTPTHMSPEQARGETVTLKPSSDIFALGVILYEMLSLKLPWGGRQVKLVLDQVLHANPSSPKEIAPERNVPPELDALTMKCLVKDADQRLQTAKELMDNLRSYVEGGTMAAVQYSFVQLFSKWLARNKAKVITTVLVVLTLIGAVGATFGILRYNALKQVPEYLAQGKLAAKEAKTALDAHNFSKALESAADAQNDFSRVLEIDSDHSEAKKGAEEMIALRGKIASDEDAWKRTAEERKRKEQEERDRQERERRLNAALADARKKLDEADGAFNGDQYTPAVRDKYREAYQSFRDVRSIDDGNKIALESMARIDAWLVNFDKQIKITEQLFEINRLLGEAKDLLARALKEEKYDVARGLLQDTIRRCDGALGIGNDIDLAVAPHKQAANIKAQAALDYAARALALSQFDFCEYMIGQAADTRELPDEVGKMRTNLNRQRDQASKFRKQFTAAQIAVTEAQNAADQKKWETALQRVREASSEAESSTFASEADKTQLSQWLQLCRLEPVRMRDAAAASVDEMAAVEGEYAGLLDSVLKDEVYKNRAAALRAELRLRLVRALTSEAENAAFDRARDCLNRALNYAADEAQRRELNRLLEDVAAREAIGKLGAKMALLRRQSYLLGSTREADSNPQRQVDFKALVFIDKYLVTNADYDEFVKAKGYENEEFWEDTPRELLVTFVDNTGKPGPASWSDGKFDATLANLPVTGISWYEARAYAKWANKRLPSADEWEIAAGAPASDKETVPEFPFGTKEVAIELGGVKTLREVGTAEWDKNKLGVRDLGSNGAEWTGSAGGDARAVIKGAEPGLKLELFLYFARRTKNGSAALSDRSLGRGFRCAKDFKFQ